MERSKSLSISSVKRYKYILIVFVSIFGLVYATSFFTRWNPLNLILGVGWFAVLILYWYPGVGKFLKKIKEVSYDKENLYVKEGGYEIQIPFYEVKDIEIVSLDGLYRFKFYHHDQFGNEVICKPSLWYPLNYKKIDAELNRIRSLVGKAHHDYKDKIGSDHSLPTHSL